MGLSATRGTAWGLWRVMGNRGPPGGVLHVCLGEGVRCVHVWGSAVYTPGEGGVLCARLGECCARMSCPNLHFTNNTRTTTDVP